MKNVDVELIQRVLNGDDTAFSALVRKYQKVGSRACVAEDWRFPHRRGYHTGYIPESLSGTVNTERTTVFCELALCDSGEPLHGVAP